MVRFKDPDQYCIKCGHSWGVTEEVCPECGFDPVNDTQDSKALEWAKSMWESMKAAAQKDPRNDP